MIFNTLACLYAVQGFLNGMTEGGFSGSINERLLGGSIAEDSLQALLNHAWSPTHLLRKVQSMNDYTKPVEL